MRNMDTGRVYLGNWLYGTFNWGGTGDVEIKEGCVGIADAVFDGQKLEHVTLPSTLLYIGACAFRGTKIKTIDIPNSVTTISAGAFQTGNLSTINVGNSVYKIGEDAFSGTLWLENQPNGVVYVGSVAYTYKYDYREIKKEELTLKGGCLGIADNFFYGPIESVTIPATVKYIGSFGWFYNDMSSIVVEDGNSVYDSREKCNAVIETSSNTLILGCKNTTIPDGITIIGRCAMQNCELTSITIPQSVKVIKERAFENTALKSITIPRSVLKMEQGVFDRNKELETISVDEGNIVYDSRDYCNAIVETPTNTLFAGCKTTFIPSSVVAVDNLSCEEMQDLYCYAENVPIATILFPSSTILHVPSGSMEVYKATTPWKNFKEIVPIGNENSIDIATDKQQIPVIWYDLNGIRLNNRPIQKGIYIIKTSIGLSRMVVVN